MVRDFDEIQALQVVWCELVNELHEHNLLDMDSFFEKIARNSHMDNTGELDFYIQFIDILRKKNPINSVKG